MQVSKYLLTVSKYLLGERGGMQVSMQVRVSMQVSQVG